MAAYANLANSRQLAEFVQGFSVDSRWFVSIRDS